VVERASHVPLYRQIEQELLSLIRAGKLQTLAQIPSEFDLCGRYGVSRMTARKALDRLVSDGILFRQPGKGTFVAPPKIPHRASTQLSFSAAIEALGLRVETKVLEAALVPAGATAAGALNVPEGALIVFIRRLRVIEAQPAAIHTAYLPSRFEDLLRQDLTRSLTQLAAEIVAPLAHSQDTIEVVSAGHHDASLLDVPPDSPLIRHQGIGFSVTSEPLRYTEGLYRSDRFRFTIDTVRPADLKPELIASQELEAVRR
jgi:GntR family transcriptional regulator